MMSRAAPIALAFAVMCVSSARADDGGDSGDSGGISSTAPLRVSYSPIAPFVMPSATDPHAAPRGFEVDIMRAIAESLERAIVWRPVKNVADNLEAIQTGTADVAIGGISITRQREDVIDFTYPVAQDGLGIVVRVDHNEGGMWATIAAVMNSARLSVLLGFVLLIVIAGHLVWWAERGSPSFHDSYIPGVFEGMYWAIVTASTVGYGDKAPVRWPGRIVAAFVIIVSLPMFAIFTAELASAITLRSVNTSAIATPRDLAGHPVAVLRATTGAAWANDQGAVVRQVDGLGAALALLNAGDVDAVVYDAPALREVVASPSSHGLTMVPGTFDLRDVGFAIAERSPLRERLNRELLTIREEGTLDRLHLTWFGE